MPGSAQATQPGTTSYGIKGKRLFDCPVVIHFHQYDNRISYLCYQKNHSARQSPSTSSPSENTIRAVMRSPLSANPSQLQNPNKKAPTKRLEQDATDHAKKRVTAKVTPTSTERVLKDRLKKSNQNLVATQKQLKEIETQSEATVENNTEVLSKTITKAVKAKEVSFQVLRCRLFPIAFLYNSR